MILTHSRNVQLALIALGLGSLACAGALVRALVTDPLPAAQQEARETPAALASRDAPSNTAAPSDALPSNDPFDPSRASLDPESVESGAPVAATSLRSAGIDVRLIGTVVLPDGASFAVCQLPSAMPRTVHVGDSIGGLTVFSIDRGHVVLRTTRGEKTEIDIVHPGS